MKIVNGVKYYTKQEVASLVSRSPQTLVLWDKWSKELEERGEPRLIPEPVRMFVSEKCKGYRMWDEHQVAEIKLFAENVAWGDLSEFTRKLIKQ